MTLDESLQDVVIRERQLESHLLRSPEYLRRVNLELRRQVAILYLAIALLLTFQVVFSTQAAGHEPLITTVLTTFTSFLAIINCLLLIRTKTCLQKLNEAWLNPQERSAVNALKVQRQEIEQRLSPMSAATGNASLN